jgi:hypothetical protein
MKHLAIATTSILLFAGSASAIERHNIETMSCQQIKTALETESPAILRYKSKKVPGMRLFNTYVGHRMHCAGGGQASVRRSVRAKDGSCTIFQCVTPSHSWYRP